MMHQGGQFLQTTFEKIQIMELTPHSVERIQNTIMLSNMNLELNLTFSNVG